MKKLKYIGILFLLILFSCVDDESRYGDIDIDEIKIEGIKDYQEIEVGGKLTIAPVVTTKFGENSDLSYVWYKYNEEQSVADTLSFEKNLDVVISDVLPGVKTTLKFKVTDNKTGVYVIEESSFTTIGKYSGGTLMLCKTGGEYDLVMLKKDGTTLYEKIYTQINEGEKLSEQSRKIILIKPYARNPRPYKAVVVTAKNNTGGVYLDPDLFVRKAYMKEKFFSGEDMTGDIGIDGYCTDQGSDYLVVNGKVHGRAYGFEETAVWNPEIVFLSAPQDYSAALYVAQPTGYPFYAAPLFYDNLHGRFMINQSGGYFSFIGGANSDFSKFDPKAMGEGVELVLSGSMNSTLNEVWALMRDKNKNEYFLITYKFIFNDDWTYDFISLSKQVLTGAAYPGLYNATAMIPGNKAEVDNYMPWNMDSKGISDIFFYVSEDKVYAFNVKTASEGVIIDGTKEHYVIDGVDCTEVAAPTTENPNATMIQLTVAIKDGNIPAPNGGIAVYKLNNIGGLAAQKLYTKAGFCDEVVATVEKQD